jgi:SAM-dependent methyltransferase
MDARERVGEHYRTLLAQNYTWMLGGDIEATAASQRDLLETLLPGPHDGPAVDLGCGSGAQTLALADLGYAPVLGVDPDPTLLAELTSNAAERPAVQVCEADAVTALAEISSDSMAACVCMGDTLLHLPDRAEVGTVIREAARVLHPGGALVLTYRDLTRPLEGTARFIPVRQDADRIMTCFLEFTDDDTVEVHDVIHARDGEGWTMTTSSYPKLRLAAEWVTGQLRAAGLAVAHHGQAPSGLWRSVGRRPT